MDWKEYFKPNWTKLVISILIILIIGIPATYYSCNTYPTPNGEEFPCLGSYKFLSLIKFTRLNFFSYEFPFSIIGDVGRFDAIMAYHINLLALIVYIIMIYSLISGGFYLYAVLRRKQKT